MSAQTSGDIQPFTHAERQRGQHTRTSTTTGTSDLGYNLTFYLSSSLSKIVKIICV